MGFRRERKASTTMRTPKMKRNPEMTRTGVAVVVEKMSITVAVNVIPIMKTMGIPVKSQLRPVRFSQTVTARRANPARS